MKAQYCNTCTWQEWKKRKRVKLNNQLQTLASAPRSTEINTSHGHATTKVYDGIKGTMVPMTDELEETMVPITEETKRDYGSKY